MKAQSRQRVKVRVRGQGNGGRPIEAVTIAIREPDEQLDQVEPEYFLHDVLDAYDVPEAPSRWRCLVSAVASKARALAEFAADHFCRLLDAVYQLIARRTRHVSSDEEWDALEPEERLALESWAAFQSALETAPPETTDSDLARLLLAIAQQYRPEAFEGAKQVELAALAIVDPAKLAAVCQHVLHWTELELLEAVELNIDSTPERVD